MEQIISFIRDIRNKYNIDSGFIPLLLSTRIEFLNMQYKMNKETVIDLITQYYDECILEYPFEDSEKQHFLYLLEQLN